MDHIHLAVGIGCVALWRWSNECLGAVLEVVLPSLVLDAATEQQRTQVVAVAPVELERQVLRQVRTQLSPCGAQLVRQFLSQPQAHLLVHVHPVAFHFNGRQQAAHVQENGAALACGLGPLNLTQEYVSGITNVPLTTTDNLAAGICQVFTQQVARQQVRVNFFGWYTCFPQYLHLVHLGVEVVVHSHVVHAQHVRRLDLPLQQVLSELAVKDIATSDNIVLPCLVCSRVTQQVQQVELDVDPDQQLRTL